MKEPEDKLERLYQEKLTDRPASVDERVWKRVDERIRRGRNRSRFFWRSLSVLLLLFLGIGAWSLLSEDEAPVKEGEPRRVDLKAMPGNEDERASLAWNEVAPSSTPTGQEMENERGAGSSEKSGEKTVPDAPSEQEERTKEVGSGSDPSRSEGGASGPESLEGSEKVRGTASDLASNPDEGASTERKDEQNADVLPDGGTGSAPSREEEAGTEDRGTENEEEATVEDKTAGPGSSEKPDPSKDPTPQEKDPTTQEREGSEDQSKTAEEKSVEKGSSKVPILPMDRPELEPAVDAGDSLPPMGTPFPRKEISKGSQAISHFYVRAKGSYGSRYRSLEGRNGSELAELRNESESPVTDFSYGLEGGVRWENGLSAGLGVERNRYGNNFSFEGSRTLYDTSYSTQSGYDYTYQDSIIYDTNQTAIDTVQVVVDSSYWEETDTSVSSHDSSYSHGYRSSYSYVTVPIMFAYELEFGDRFSVVPGVGVGMNFLVRSRTGWVDPNSHEEVRMRYPEEEPPLKRFALSLKGRMELRYRIGDSWQIGAGFRYSRFLHSVHTDAVNVDERPYGYGGSFSLSYSLGSGDPP